MLLKVLIVCVILAVSSIDVSRAAQHNFTVVDITNHTDAAGRGFLKGDPEKMKKELICVGCIFLSMEKAPSCSKLAKDTFKSIQDVFTTGQVNWDSLGKIAHSADVKGCICEWASGAFLQNGFASHCQASKNSTCTPDNIILYQIGVRVLIPVLRCNAPAGSKGPQPPIPIAHATTQPPKGDPAKPPPGPASEAPPAATPTEPPAA